MHSRRIFFHLNSSAPIHRYDGNIDEITKLKQLLENQAAANFEGEEGEEEEIGGESSLIDQYCEDEGRSGGRFDGHYEEHEREQEKYGRYEDDDEREAHEYLQQERLQQYEEEFDDNSDRYARHSDRRGVEPGGGGRTLVCERPGDEEQRARGRYEGHGPRGGRGGRNAGGQEHGSEGEDGGSDWHAYYR